MSPELVSGHLQVHACMCAPCHGIASHVIRSSCVPTHPHHEKVSDASLGLFVPYGLSCLLPGSGVSKQNSSGIPEDLTHLSETLQLQPRPMTSSRVSMEVTVASL